MHPTPAALGTLRHAALRWSPEALRIRWDAGQAVHTLLHALVHQTLDPQVAGPKLAWWHAEADRLAVQQASLPALQALHAWQGSAQDHAAWLHHALDGVARFRERKTPFTTSALCQQWAQWGEHLWWPCAHNPTPWSPEERAYVRALGALDVGMRWCDHWVLGHPEALWVLPHDLRLAHGLQGRCTPENAQAYHQAWCVVFNTLMTSLSDITPDNAPWEALAIYGQGLLLLAQQRVSAAQASVPRLWPLSLLWHAWRTHTTYRTKAP